MGELDRLLSLTSRTFALSIPRLPQPLRDQVAVGYLVFRIADTIEDEGEATTAQRVEALRNFLSALTANDPVAVRALLTAWHDQHPPDHEGYAELLRRGHEVCARLDEIAPSAADPIRHHVGRTIDGMTQQLLEPREIADVPGVRRYCYHVAGIVGELCSDLFVAHHAPLANHRERLLQLAPCFGEALQLVNILRDQGIDLAAGRRYVPDAETRRQLFDLAQQGCAASHDYLDILRTADAPAGVIEFNAFNLRLAEATLQLVREHGAGAKVSRQVVADVMRGVQSR